MSLPKQIRVRVLRRHYNLATENGKIPLKEAFGRTTMCPMAQALKERFPNEFQSTGGIALTFKTAGQYWIETEKENSYSQVIENKPFTFTLKKI